MKTKKLLKYSAWLGSFLAVVSAEAAKGPQPTICTRSCWNARSPSCSISQMSGLTRAIIHHTAGASDYTTSYSTAQAKVRGVQNIHMDGNGWCDIGYHFLVSAGGHIFEGRSGSMSSQPRGSHDGNNTDSFGFNVMGNYADNSEGGGANQHPTAASLDSLYDVIAWRMPSSWSPYGSGSYNGNTVGKLDSHRKVKATACPGNNIHNVYIKSDYNGGPARDGVNCRKNGNCAASIPDRLDIFARSTTNSLIHKWWSAANGWSATWDDMGGAITSDPTCVAKDALRLTVFARNANGELTGKFYDGTSWSGWTSHAGQIVGAPEASSWGTDDVHIFARSTSNTLLHKYYTGSGYSGWTDLGGNIYSSPTAVSREPGRLSVFALNSIGQITSRYWDGSAWSGWTSLGAPSVGIASNSAPDAVSRNINDLDVFVRGANGRIYMQDGNAGEAWTGTWVAVGTETFTSDPGAASYVSDIEHAFARGADGKVWKNYWVADGAGWRGWDNSLGGNVIGGVDACSWSNTVNLR